MSCKLKRIGAISCLYQERRNPAGFGVFVCAAGVKTAPLRMAFTLNETPVFSRMRANFQPVHSLGS
ncbi:MAG: hypothetical protein ACTS5G_04050, partial [Burkholderiales bacterium]